MTVTVTDDDTAAITASPTTLSVNEGATGTYTVKLTAQPSAAVTVSIAPPGGSGVTVTPAVLTFTTDNWSTAQTVTVTAAHDDDLANDTAALAHTAAGGGYNDATATVTVTVTDDDTAAITVSPTTLSVNEGATGTYTVKLTAQPGAIVTVSIAPPGGSGVTVSPAVLTFTTDNWSTAQTVTVTAAHDDDLANDMVTLTHTATGTGNDTPDVEEVKVTVVDDDTAAITVSPTTLSVNEGATGTYTVKLAAQPSANVTVSVTGHNSSDVSVSPATLTFTSANWSTAQTVTVTAAHDANITNDIVMLAHNATGGGYNDATATVTVTVTNDDTAAIDEQAQGGQQISVFTAGWSNTTIAEDESTILTVTTSDTSVTGDTIILVTLHVGRNEGTANRDDIEVLDHLDNLAKVDPMTPNKHHDGGWLYLKTDGSLISYDQATTKAMTLQVLNDADSANEVLVVWVYVNGDLAGWQILTLTPS